MENYLICFTFVLVTGCYLYATHYIWKKKYVQNFKFVILIFILNSTLRPNFL